MRASAWIRSACRGSGPSATLMATGRPSDRSVPRNTVAVAPRPSSSRSRKRLSGAPGSVNTLASGPTSGAGVPVPAGRSARAVAEAGVTG